jgi:serine/threonine-protein kinase
MSEQPGAAASSSGEIIGPIAVPEKLGRFRVVRPIGAGGMGHVYLARDPRLRRQVAIKVLAPSMTSDPSAVERFAQEAHAVSALNHPNILTIYDIGEDDGVHFIATEFVEGQTVRQRMRESGFTLAEVVDIAAQTAGALGVAHDAGVIHRDIKPENVMIRRDGYVKILDFGIAKLTARKGAEEGESLSRTATTPGTVLGTAHYMSPEQVRGQIVDARTDIFSLGVMLYEMISGRLPFNGESAGDVIAMILTHEPAPVGNISIGVPPELETLITRALSKDRGTRYPAAADLLRDLKRIEVDGAAGHAVRPAGDMHDAISTQILPAAPTRARSRKAIDSLAVLPFVNELADPDADYLSDGITESIINSLSLLQKVRVIPRSTVFRFKGGDQDPLAIGRELGVRAVFAGSIRQVADSLIFNAELIDVVNEAQVWGEQYRRKVTDIFRLQTEIAEDISDKLKLRLTGAQKKRLRKQHTDNTEAYRFYLKGRYFVTTKRTEEWIDKGIDQFQQAIDLDPNYALAYAGIAEAYGFLASSTGGWAPRSAYPKAIAAAERALKLDGSLSEAHCSLGFAELLYRWDLSAAGHEFQEAIRLNPVYPTALDGYGFYLKAIERYDEAIEIGRKVLELDPLSAFAHVSLSYAYYFQRDFQRAIAECQKALELDRGSSFAHRTIGMSQLLLGRNAEAIGSLQQAVEFSNGAFAFESALGFAYGVTGQRDHAAEILRRLRSQLGQRYVSAYDIAMIYLGMDDFDATFDWLGKAVQERSGFIAFLRVEPALDPIRSDPRFLELLGRIASSPE